MAQSTYTQTPAIGKRGGVSDDGHGDDLTVALAAATIPGRLLIRSNQTVSPIPVAEIPVASAADPDAIIATGASSDAIQTLDAADFDGVGAGGGGAYFNVPAFITFTFSNSTDWDATNITVTGIGADGEVATDTIAIPDGGNQTVTGDVAFWKITEVSIPAQTADGGTFTMGVAATGRELTGAQVLGVAKRDALVIDDDELAANRCASARRRGRIFVETDETVLVGAPAFVRVIADGVKLPGMFRDDADSGAAVALTGARFTRVISASLAEVNLDGGY